MCSTFSGNSIYIMFVTLFDDVIFIVLMSSPKNSTGNELIIQEKSLFKLKYVLDYFNVTSKEQEKWDDVYYMFA